MTTEISESAVYVEVRQFLYDWFKAIQTDDRGWIESHLASDFSDWLVPTGKPLPRKTFIDIQIGMTEFTPELFELKVLETGGFVSALMKMTVREVFPPSEEQTPELRAALSHGDLQELLHGELLDPDSGEPVVVNSIFRRKADGELEVVHHMLVGPAA